jgi:polysaccharide export outer membrane protein
MGRKLIHQLLVFTLLFLQASCAQIQPAQDGSHSNNQQIPFTSTIDEYRIGPEDLLGIEVFQVKDFSLEVRVSTRGFISLPLIGNVQAAGFTNEQLEKRIAQKLSERYLQNPHVSVFIEEYTSQRVTVEGGVNTPGMYALKGRTTLLQTIAMAQGLSDLADPNHVQVYRNNPDGKKQMFVYDIDAIRSGDAQDPLLVGDDIVVVHKSGVKAFVKGITDTLRGFVSFGRIN